MRNSWTGNAATSISWRKSSTAQSVNMSMPSRQKQIRLLPIQTRNGRIRRQRQRWRRQNNRYRARIPRGVKQKTYVRPFEEAVDSAKKAVEESERAIDEKNRREAANAAVFSAEVEVYSAQNAVNATQAAVGSADPNSEGYADLLEALKKAQSMRTRCERHGPSRRRPSQQGKSSSFWTSCPRTKSAGAFA